MCEWGGKMTIVPTHLVMQPVDGEPTWDARPDTKGKPQVLTIIVAFNKWHYDPFYHIGREKLVWGMGVDRKKYRERGIAAKHSVLGESYTRVLEIHDVATPLIVSSFQIFLL